MTTDIRAGTHGWYIYNVEGQIVDRPFCSKREAQEMRIFYLDLWRSYYPDSSALTIKSEGSLAQFVKPKGDRRWKVALK